MTGRDGIDVSSNAKRRKLQFVLYPHKKVFCLETFKIGVIENTIRVCLFVS